jgi:nicotinate-nucleotide adenylyltransferase
METTATPLPAPPNIRRLCFGGTFNPIHHAHLICARAVAEAAGFDRVTLIPSAQPPHKPNATGVAAVAPAEDRLAMCRLAVEGDAMFEVNDLELHRAGPSYTIDTVRQLNREGWPEVSWLIGGDTVPQLPSWHQPAALLAEARLVVMARPGWELDWSNIPLPYQVLKSQVFVAPLIEISATEIRRRIQDGRPILYLTPPAVADYITQRRLYQKL